MKLRLLMTVGLVFVAASARAAGSLGGCQLLPDNHIFNTPIQDLPVHPDSAAYIQTIRGTPLNLHLDMGQQSDQTEDDFYGIPYNVIANADDLVWKSVNFYTSDPDAYFDGASESECGDGDADNILMSPCDGVANPKLPIPDNPIVEGGIVVDQSNYGDHHILIVDSAYCHLWELYHAYPNGAEWDILSSAFFDLAANDLHTATWTSADAAGFAILPLLLRASEAATGTIAHALRFTINSDKIRAAYVWPATHKTNNGGSSTAKPAMGQLFRLKASYQIPAHFSVQSKAILQALKTYGMYLADGGSDAYITGDPSATWDDSVFSQVQSVPHTQFEAVDISAITSRPGFDAASGAVPGAGSGGNPGGGNPGNTNPGGTNTGNENEDEGSGGSELASGSAVQGGCQSAASGTSGALLLAAIFLLRFERRRRGGARSCISRA